MMFTRLDTLSVRPSYPSTLWASWSVLPDRTLISDFSSVRKSSILSSSGQMASAITPESAFPSASAAASPLVLSMCATMRPNTRAGEPVPGRLPNKPD